MEVALYRGRGSDIILVHACMRPPGIAQHRHGPLRYLDTVDVDGQVLGAHWAAFADQIEAQSFAVLEERDGLRLLRQPPGASPVATTPPSPHS